MNNNLTIATTIMVFLLLLLSHSYRSKAIKKQTSLHEELFKNLDPNKKFEEILSSFLSMVSGQITAENYYFYVFEEQSERFSLKCLRLRDDENGMIEPSYSGLVEYKKESFQPPLIFTMEVQDKPAIVKIGEVSFLAVAVGKKSGLILAGPLKRIPFGVAGQLEKLAEMFQNPLIVIAEIEKLRQEVSTAKATGQAISSLSQMAMDTGSSLKALLGLSLKIVDAAGALLIYMKNGSPELTAFAGLNEKEIKAIKKDTYSLEKLVTLSEENSFTVLSKKSPDFGLIPMAIAVTGAAEVLLMPFGEGELRATAIFWFFEENAREEHRISALKMVTARMAEAYINQENQKKLSASYLNSLRILTDQFDSQEPYTVSHSLLISKYSGIIAREMSLSDEEIKSVMLAGYFHDLGMLGLAGDVLFKEGKYTSLEQETMRVHAEVGGAMAESILGAETAGKFIRCHHERWDGLGYPMGLKGEEIPLGGRIITVADTFVAKISGRKNREPLPFAKAIETLKAAAGNQLDPGVVAVLINWLHKKENNNGGYYVAPGTCWQVRCCPNNLHENCIAFREPEVGKKCWEMNNVLCAGHGNTCQTCMVYTGANDKVS